MEPIPETVLAVSLLATGMQGRVLLDDLRELGRRVRDVVPDCVGLSFTLLERDLTLTLLASPSELAILDALPDVAGPLDDRPEPAEPPSDPLDEGAWRRSWRATAAPAVASTLSMPVRREGRFVGRINLYGASSNAFTGHHEELAERLGTWRQGSVVNTDLEFRTRQDAIRAPWLLRGPDES